MKKTQTKKTQGYLLVCLGASYIYDALDFIQTLRHHGDLRPIDVIVDPEDEKLASDLKTFNRVMTYSVADSRFYNKSKPALSFNILRMDLYKFLKFDYTMTIDIDMLCSRPTDFAWNALISHGQWFTALGRLDSPSWHWGQWGKICKAININPIETHGGLLFFNNDYISDSDAFLKKLWYCFDNYDSLGMLSKYSRTAPDEPMWAFACHHLNYKPLVGPPWGEGVPIMNHNSKISDLNQGHCFHHMFCKNHANEFKALKNHILLNT